MPHPTLEQTLRIEDQNVHTVLVRLNISCTTHTHTTHTSTRTSVSVSDQASSRLRLRDGFIFSKGGCAPCWRDREATVSLQAKLTFWVYFGIKRKEKERKCKIPLIREINKKGVNVLGLTHVKLTEGIMRLTGLKVSRPKLPLLFRLPISVWELDWDIPSKNGLFENRQEKPQHATL